MKNINKYFNVDFLGYLCHLIYTLRIEKNICTKRNQIVKFENINIILENYICCMFHNHFVQNGDF